MKFKFTSGLRLWAALLVLLTLVLSTAQPTQASTIPTFSIVSVVEDTSVTIRTHAFPAGQTFTVRMGKYGTYGKGGVVVGTTESGAGGSFEVKYDIPDSLAGQSKIAIRMDSPAGYYSFNWFYNQAAPAPAPVPEPLPGYKGIPTFSITDVERNEEVKVHAVNLPPGQTFTVRMGEYGTLGIGGIKVTTFDSGEGGKQDLTFSIPDALAGREKIAIRMDCPLGYYAFNWFWNQDTSVTPAPTPEPVTPGYKGIPTFSISAVTRDAEVKVHAVNLPPDQTFTVRMGNYGTLAVGGTVTGTFDSGEGGTQDLTFTIPAGLAGLQRIAVRFDCPAGYYAFNWFWNNTTP
jgi:hypothetical protein